MKKILNKFMKSTVIKFILVGGCSTGIDFAIYMVLSAHLSIMISKAISMIVASVFSYIINKNFTFNNNDKTNFGYLIRFYIVLFLNFGTNIGVNYAIYSNTGKKFIAFVSATLCGMTVNYLGQRFIVFKKDRFIEKK